MLLHLMHSSCHRTLLEGEVIIVALVCHWRLHEWRMAIVTDSTCLVAISTIFTDGIVGLVDRHCAVQLGVSKVIQILHRLLRPFQLQEGVQSLCLLTLSCRFCCERPFRALVLLLG